jgi:hypothetical protein
MVVVLCKSVAYWVIYSQKVKFCNSIHLGQNFPVVPREKIDDNFSETTKVLIFSDIIMLGLGAKSHLIENYLLYKID